MSLATVDQYIDWIFIGIKCSTSFSSALLHTIDWQVCLMRSRRSLLLAMPSCCPLFLREVTIHLPRRHWVVPVQHRPRPRVVVCLNSSSTGWVRKETTKCCALTSLTSLCEQSAVSNRSSKLCMHVQRTLLACVAAFAFYTTSGLFVYC